MSLFGIDFYPTPPELARQMLAPYFDGNQGSGQYNLILEPSAGHGNLLSAISNVYLESIKAKNMERQKRYEENNVDWRNQYYISESEAGELKKKIHVCEIDPNLQSILRDNGYHIVNDDFLKYDTGFRYNLIVMNPPFSRGAEHVLKAISLLAPGGKLVALLNAKSLVGSTTQRYESLRQLIKKHGSAISAGKAFVDAERKTEVEVALIRYQDPRTESENLFDMSGFHYVDGKIIEEVDMSNPNEIATRDVIGNLLKQYDEVKDRYLTYRREARHLKKLMSLFDFQLNKNIDEHYMSGRTDAEQYNNFLLELNAAAWRTVFRLTGMKKRMTERMKKQFEDHQKETAMMAFNRENINAAIMLLLDNQGTIMLQCILDCYDELTRYTNDNVEADKRFKTNNAFRVKKRVIIPYCVEWSSWSGFSIRYNAREGIISDLDKAMCFISGNRIEDIVTIPEAMNRRKETLRESQKGMIDTTVESTFFDLRFFKKGTLHITFKDKDLWERFNMTVAKERGWLQDYEPGKTEVSSQ